MDINLVKAQQELRILVALVDGGTEGGNAGDGKENGGQGGEGNAANSNYVENGGGGAGNPGGIGGTGAHLDPYNYKGEDGTGGLLIIYCNLLSNNGKITANGMKGGKHDGGGGSSGGGTINIFYILNYQNSNGVIQADGGLPNGKLLGRSRRKWNSFNRKNNEWKLYR